MKSLATDRETPVLDGAMGTQLIERGLTQGQPSILWNADRPDDIRAVHQSYADAGAVSLTTNTFGGNLLMLQRSGLEGRLGELNRRAVSLAREASAGRCWVMGDIGPCGDFLEPLGELTPAQLTEAVKRQAGTLGEAGVDGFIVETMSDPRELQVTVAAVKSFGLTVFASYTYERTATGRQTMMGTRAGEATRLAVEAGADAVGANCGTSLSLDEYLVLAEEILAEAHGKPVFLQPNAGTPIATADGYRYDVSPDDFAAWATRASNLGVTFLGGCCGTTPAHIAAVVRAVSGA